MTEPTPPPPDDFPRGGAAPPQPLPRGANLALILISVGVIGSAVAMLAWLLH
jgi:hypothetical protein